MPIASRVERTWNGIVTVRIEMFAPFLPMMVILFCASVWRKSNKYAISFEHGLVKR